MADTARLMGREDAAQYLGIPGRTLYALVRTGEVAAVRVGRVLRFDPQHLDEWRRRQTRNAPESEPEPLAAPPVDLAEVSRRPLEARLLGAVLAEQRHTNRLLTRLLNRRS